MGKLSNERFSAPPAGSRLLLLAVVLALAAALWWGLCAPAERPAVELRVEQVRADGTTVRIPVTAVLPQTTEAAPLVVFCHGFTGSRWCDGHYATLSQRLAEYGIASVTLDFPGNGDSTEPFTSYTLENMCSDVRRVMEYMCENYRIDPGRIGLLGHSMGGRVVSLCLDESIAAAALWSPADNKGLQGLEFIKQDPDDLEALREQARREGAVPAWGVLISSAFIEQMAASDPWASIEAYQGALLLAFAGQDATLFSEQTIQGTLEAVRGRGLPFVDLTEQFADATHNFTAWPDDDDFETQDARIRGRIEEATADFFRDVFQ